jgi:hypothetical protein
MRGLLDRIRLDRHVAQRTPDCHAWEMPSVSLRNHSVESGPRVTIRGIRRFMQEGREMALGFGQSRGVKGVRY